MKKYLIGASLAVVLSFIAISPAFAQSNKPLNKPTNRPQMNKLAGQNRGAGMMRPTFIGKVTTISGNTFTVLGHNMSTKNSATSTFTVNASKAKIIKNNKDDKFSSIIVGDNVIVQGTISGNTVSATMIRAGVLAQLNNRSFGMERENQNWNASSTASSTASTSMMRGDRSGRGDGNPANAGAVPANNHPGFFGGVGQFFKHIFGF